MADFKKALEKTLKHEGGWSNHEADKGGCTMSGVTISTFQTHFGEEKTCDDLKKITPYQVEYIYKLGYWDRIKGDLIEDQRIAEFLFDWACNSGPKTAIKRIQTLVGVESDGILGKKTIEAINKKNPWQLFRELYDCRIGFYKLLVQKNPSQKVFLKGWLRRCESYKN